ncbi:MAG: RNA polymerase sigma factor [Acidimicrobiales bacterium]
MHLVEHTRADASRPDARRRSSGTVEDAGGTHRTRESNALYEQLHPALLRFLRRRVGPGAAPDVAAEVWVGLALAITDYGGTLPQLRALMFTIARRRVVDHFRRAERQVCTVPLDETLEVPDKDDTETLAVDSLTTAHTVRWLAAQLPRDQAQVVLLRVVGGLDGHRVAAVTGKSAGAVRVVQHRALRSLREQCGAREPVTL